LTYLKIADLNAFDVAVDKFNKGGKTPVVIIDNVENAFTTSIKQGENSNSPICEYFRLLYENKNVHVIFASNSFEV